MAPNIISVLIFALLIYGRCIHKNVKVHVRTMVVVILADTCLVLYLAFVPRVLKNINFDMPPLLYLHIALALGVLGLYYYAIWVGLKLLRGEQHMRKRMKLLDRIILTLRTGVLATSLILAFT